MKTVTVVTVVRNAGNLLITTMDSVHRQSIRKEMEYLVVDGHSTDDTLNVIQAAAAQGVVDSWISEPDLGIYDAMRKGLAMAQGDWILFMNAGDGFHSEQSLEILLQAAERHTGCSGVYGGCVVIYPDGHRKTENPRPPRHIYTQMVCSHQSLLLRTDKAREYPFDLRYKIAADHHQLMRMIYKFEPVYPVQAVISEVSLENYSWAQLSEGLKEKRQALWEVTGNLFFYLFHWWRLVGKAVKHTLKNLLRRGKLKK